MFWFLRLILCYKEDSVYFFDSSKQINLAKKEKVNSISGQEFFIR